MDASVLFQESAALMYAVPAVIAVCLSAVLTSVIRRVALRVGFVDRPDGHRKLHVDAVPLGGGVAIFLAVAATITAAEIFDLQIGDAISRIPRFSVGLLGASALVCLLGLLDDALELRGRQKLAAQIVAVFMVVQAGLSIDQIELFGLSVELGLLAVPVTMVWLLGAINALNLIDGVRRIGGNGWCDFERDCRCPRHVDGTRRGRGDRICACRRDSGLPCLQPATGKDLPRRQWQHAGRACAWCPGDS